MGSKSGAGVSSRGLEGGLPSPCKAAQLPCLQLAAPVCSQGLTHLFQLRVVRMARVVAVVGAKLRNEGLQAGAGTRKAEE